MLFDKLNNKLQKKSANHATADRTSKLIQPDQCPKSRSQNRTPIQIAVEQELTRYFELLDGQTPHDLHRMVMCQVENTLIDFVMDECGHNQTRAAEYLGISRGTLRTKLSDQ